MLVHAVYALYLLHPSNNCDVMPHPVKICERRSAKWWTGQDLSRWYGLVFRGSFYQSPTRALTTVRTKAVVRSGFVVFVIYRSIRLWMVAMLGCCDVTLFVGEHSLEANTQKQQRSVHAIIGHRCAAEREQLLFVLLIVQEAAIPVTLCDWSTTIAKSCLWIRPMPLMCESF